jgi:hypothetical protein
MTEIRDTYSILTGKQGGKRPLGKIREIMLCSCETLSASSGSIKHGEILENLTDFRHLKDSERWS